MKTTLGRMVLIAAGLAGTFGFVGCSASSAGSSSDSSATSGSLSGADKEARNAALAELQRHWAKGADGWTAAVTTGSAYAPDHFLRQYRELSVATIEPQELSESDRLNGFQWVGKATFKPTVCREAGGQPTFVLDGMGEGSQAYVQKVPGSWSQWVDFTPGPMQFQKVKGAWQFQWDSTYLRGDLPSPNDFAVAGVH